jgi:fatty acid desaturase
VVIHGTAVAIMNGQASWPMFLFGFLIPFFLTHVFSFPLWPEATREKPWTIIIRGIPFAVVLIAWLLMRSLWLGYAMAYSDLFIPLLLYAFVFVFALFHWIAVIVSRKICKCGRPGTLRDFSSNRELSVLILTSDYPVLQTNRLIWS